MESALSGAHLMLHISPMKDVREPDTFVEPGFTELCKDSHLMMLTMLCPQTPVSVPLLSESHSSSPGQASYVLQCPAAPSPTQKPQSRAGSSSPSGLLPTTSAALFTPLSQLATSKSSLTHPSCSWQSFIKPRCFVSEMSCTSSLSSPSPPTAE